MTNEEILRKAIEKAIKNGYDFDGFLFSKDYERLTWEYVSDDGALTERIILHYGDLDAVTFYHPRELIFSHSFAKGFFPKGDGMIVTSDGARAGEYWIHHIQIMSAEKEPLRYIEKFLEG